MPKRSRGLCSFVSSGDLLAVNKGGVISKVKVKSTIPDELPTFEILLSDRLDSISDKRSHVYRCTTTFKFCLKYSRGVFSFVLVEFFPFSISNVMKKMKNSDFFFIFAQSIALTNSNNLSKISIPGISLIEAIKGQNHRKARF